MLGDIMLAVESKAWMQLPSYASNAIPNNTHLPPPPPVNGIPASTGSMTDVKPYIGEDVVAGSQMTHLSRQISQTNAGHNHSNNTSSASKSSQERVKRPMNAFMVRIVVRIRFLLLLLSSLKINHNKNGETRSYSARLKLSLKT